MPTRRVSTPCSARALSRARPRCSTARRSTSCWVERASNFAGGSFQAGPRTAGPRSISSWRASCSSPTARRRRTGRHRPCPTRPRGWHRRPGPRRRRAPARSGTPPPALRPRWGPPTRWDDRHAGRPGPGRRNRRRTGPRAGHRPRKGPDGPAQRAGQGAHPGRGVAGRGPHRRPGQQQHADEHHGDHGHPGGPGPHQATEGAAGQGSQSPAGADEPVDGLAPGGTSPGQVEQGAHPGQHQQGADHRAHDGRRFGVGAPTPQDHDAQRHQQQGDHPGGQAHRRAHAGGQARAHGAGPVHVDAQRGDYAHHDQQGAGHVVTVAGEALAQCVTQPGPRALAEDRLADDRLAGARRAGGRLAGERLGRACCLVATCPPGVRG